MGRHTPRWQHDTNTRGKICVYKHGCIICAPVDDRSSTGGRMTEPAGLTGCKKERYQWVDFDCAKGKRKAVFC